MKYWPLKLLGLVLVPGAILLGALNSRYAFSGEKVIVQKAGESSVYVSSILPTGRASGVREDQQGQKYKAVLTEPVYVDLNLYRAFNELDLEMIYKNDLISQISLGVQKGQENQFELKPVENLTLDKILSDAGNWSVTENNGIFLIQRQSAPKKFTSLEDLLNNLPSEDSVAVYNYDLQRYFRIKNYRPSNRELVIDRSVRGAHQILTYIKDEPMNWTFKLQDINRADGPDPIEVLVFRGSELIHGANMEDDGGTATNVGASAQREIKINLPALPEGAYRIELRVSDDIFWRQIKTTQSKVVFVGRVFLSDNAEYHDAFPELRTDPVTLYTNGNRVTAHTPHHKGLQTLQMDSQLLEINETQKNFVHYMGPYNGSLHKIVSPINDIKLETGGVFAFSQEAFFNPNFSALDTTLNDVNKINYVVARYDRPEPFGDLKIVRQRFDITNAYKKGNQLRLIISLFKNSTEETLKIYQIKVTLKGRKLGPKEIFEKLFK